jgi:hypothetical protein
VAGSLPGVPAFTVLSVGGNLLLLTLLSTFARSFCQNLRVRALILNYRTSAIGQISPQISDYPNVKDWAGEEKKAIGFSDIGEEKSC